MNNIKKNKTQEIQLTKNKPTTENKRIMYDDNDRQQQYCSFEEKQ